MRRLLGACLLLVALSVVLPAHDAAAGTAAERARVIDLVNGERARGGLAPLWENAALTRSGEAYAASMAANDFFGHTGRDGSTVASRDEAAGYVGWTWLGENIAAGQSTPELVFKAWMDSPDHRANMLSPSAREIGIGHGYSASARYGHYWTMELGNRPGAAPPATAPTPTPPPRPVGPASAFRLHVPVSPKVPSAGL